MSEKKLLFVNACVNKSTSRTLRIASRLLELLKESYVIEELDLEHLDIHPLDSQRLNERLVQIPTPISVYYFRENIFYR